MTAPESDADLLRRAADRLDLIAEALSDQGLLGAQIAAPLAAWLRAMAPDVQWKYDLDAYRHALATARAILGETGETT